MSDCQEFAELEIRQRWIDAVIEKQYELYARRDSKLQSIATLDALLIASIAFAFDSSVKPLAAFSLIICAALIFVSILLSLWHIRPTISSGRSVGSDANVRSLTGIQSFASWESYRDTMRTVPPEAYFESSVRQAYGMSSTNLKSYRVVRFAVFSTMAATAALMLAAIAQWWE